MREMKDSGIQWLREYPANWNLIKIKYCLKERVEKNNPARTSFYHKVHRYGLT
jgi:type I restriction enzyme, S subunit